MKKNEFSTQTVYLPPAPEVELTPSQAEAVNFGKGPLLIVAGAGTGKTLCIAHRVKNLILNKKAEPDEILVLTFSEKAAAEMEERIDLILPYAFSDVWVSTFHSFGKRMLERHPIEAGISPNFQVLKPEETVLFLKEHLFELPLDRFRPLHHPLFHLRAIAGLISRLKDEDISPAQYLEFANSLPESDDDPAAVEKKQDHMELARTYGVITDLMRENNFVDMADLVYLALEMFRNHPHLTRKYQEQFKYILVDEFQDTNHSQYQLLKTIVNREKNLTVVGDDDQSIYKFRGAAISNILNFCDDFPDARQVVLSENFRSPQIILDAAYKLITHNNPYRLEVKNDIDKELKGRTDKKAVLFHRVFDTEQNQAQAIADLVEEKVKSGYDYSDIAILIRANKNADSIIREFNLREIPVNFPGGSKLYSRPEIRALISFFRVIARPNDSLSLYHLSGSEFYNLDPGALNMMIAYADRFTQSLEEVFNNISDIESFKNLSERTRKKVEKITRDIKKFRQLSIHTGAGRLLYQFLSSSSYLEKLARGQVSDPEIKTRNVAAFFRVIKRYEEVSQYPMAVPFLNHLEDLMEAGDEPSAAVEEMEVDAVPILTVHRAKGLEFGVVIIASLAEGNFPSRKRSVTPDVPDELVKERMISPDFHVQEERRLCYVAMTRAKNELYMMGVRDFGGKRRRKISRFLMEALDMPMKNIRVSLSEPLEVIQSFAPQETEKKKDETAFGEIKQVTPFHLDDYITCPLKYKYVHVLKIPVMRHHRVVYGKAVRQTVLHFLRRKTEGLPTDFEDLLTVFSREWEQEGFLTRKHEEMRFEEGITALKNFFIKFKDEITTEDVADRQFKFFFDRTRVVGSWDLLRKRESGNVILNFRASGASNKRSANRKIRDSLKNQVAILAYNEIFGEMPGQLNSYFLNSGIMGKINPGEKLLTKIREKISPALEGIRNGDYTPSPDYYKCNSCAYFEICPATDKII